VDLSLFGIRQNPNWEARFWPSRFGHKIFSTPST
jgi:hypothetical protein